MPDGPLTPLNPADSHHFSDFIRRVLIIIALVVATLVIGAVLILGSEIVFLFFAAILLALLLRRAGDYLASKTGLNGGWAYTIVVVSVLALIAGGVTFFGSTVVAQVSDLAAKLPQSTDQARARLAEYPQLQQAFDRLPPVSEMLGQAGSVAGATARFFTTSFGVLGNLLVLGVLALYLGAAPQTYLEGFVQLVPPSRRSRARKVLDVIGAKLQYWLLGRLVAIIAVGIIVGIGLWLAGVPQFFVLALVAAVFTAIPFVGPILGLIPGLIVALTVSPTTAAYALLTYVVAQLVENYIVTPLVQQRTVNMPPVLTIAAIALIGGLTGVMGLIVAAPLAVTLKVVVQMLYIEDTLGDDTGVAA